MARQSPKLFLPDDIALLIIEQIHQNALASLTDLCLVSTQFCKLTTPILYRSIELVPAQLPCEDNHESTSHYPYDFQANFIAYTREVTIKTALDWQLVTDLLSRMNYLDALRWKYWAKNTEPFPKSVGQLLSTRWPNCKLHIEDLAMIGSPMLLMNPMITSHLLGCRNIRSINAWPDYQQTKIASQFKELLIGCPGLEILHIKKQRLWHVRPGRQAIPAFDLGILPGDKLPPVKKLVVELFLKGLPTRFWDFTNLKHLEVRSHFAFSFFGQLQNPTNCVQTLIVEQRPLLGFVSESEEIDALNTFISNGKGIENLTIINGRVTIPARTICIHGDTLQSLTLHQPRCGPNYPTLADRPYYSPDDFKMLNRCCPHLSTMIVNLRFPNPEHSATTGDPIIPEPGEYLIALAQFPKLKSLRLLSCFGGWTSYHEFERSGNYYQTHLQNDTMTAHRIFSYLQKHKIGARFEKLEVIFGAFPKDYYLKPALSKYHDRPEILFTCKISDRGEVLVEDDCNETVRENPMFAYYFSDSILADTKPSFSYLEDFMEWIEAGDEADSEMKRFLDVEGNEGDVGVEANEGDVKGDVDVDSLFGDAASTEGLATS